MKSGNPKESIAFKSNLTIVVLLLFFTVIVGVIGYNGFSEALLDQYADGAFKTADAAALRLNPDRMDAYIASGGETEEYKQVLNDLNRICDSTGATFVYVIQPDLSDYNHITFIFSGINSSSSYQQYEFGYVRETTNDDYRQKYKAIYEGKIDQALVVRDKGYIETDPHITAMIPLKGDDRQIKGILCVQRQMKALVRARNAYLRRVAMVMLIILFFIYFVQKWSLKKMLLTPITDIHDEAVRFANENVLPESKLSQKITNKDEIGRLAAAIDGMEEQIVEYVEDLTVATAARERIEAELGLANRIQANMLQTEFPAFPDRKEFDIYARMTPAKEVGGDFYGFYLTDQDHLCCFIADVSDKGVPAALFMMSAYIILSDQAMMGSSPAKILENTNKAICARNPEDMFLTVWLGILEISTGKLTAANAGHEYPAIKKSDGRFELLKDKHGFVLGGMDGLTYKDYEIQMEPGCKIFVYTDGVPEASNAEGKPFGLDRMIQVLNEVPDGSPEEILDQVRTKVDEFAGDAKQFDDLTMLCLEYHP